MCKSNHGEWSWMCGKCLLINNMQPPAAQRQWVDLTPQDFTEVFKNTITGEGAVHLALEKFKEKNNGFA
jgi:hypothetical protein